MNRIYLDANATTPLAPEVFEAMRPWMLDRFGNASSIHYYGQKSRGAVEEARVAVAVMLNCRPAEIVFTSGGTEGDNLAIFGMMQPGGPMQPGGLTQPDGLMQPGDHLITSSIEHHAVLHAAEALRKRGIEVTFLAVNSQSVVDPADVRRALRPNTRLISIMMANNETGAIQPVAEIGRIAAEADVYFHTDAVQAAAKLPIDVARIGCDLLTIAAHKMYGPQGVGALYVRRGTQLEPLFFGGTHERQRRAGTENVAGIVGFGKAAQLAAAAVSGAAFKPSIGLNGNQPPRHPERSAAGAESKDLRFVADRATAGAPPLDVEIWERTNPPTTNSDTREITRIAQLRDRLETGLLHRLEDVGVNGGEVPRVPNTTNLWFDHLEGEALVIALDMKGLAVSGGSACASGATEPSHVLTAMGMVSNRARASLRFSLTRYTTEEEIDRALELVPAAVARLREIAPIYAGTLG